MKDYSNSKEERRKFILKYEVDGQNLVIYLANKEKYIIPYTVSNEKEILKRMREQIPSKEEQKKLSGSSPIVFWVSYIIAIAFMALGIKLGTFIINLPVSIILLAVTLPIDFKNTQKYEDLKKLNLWLKNEMELKENAFNSKNLYNGVSKKTAKIISSKKAANVDAFSINAISEYSVKDIEKMLDNIKRQKEFNFEEQEITEAELHDLAISAPKLSKKIK